jgi:isopenicillin-N N-acyltransferase-like protein
VVVSDLRVVRAEGEPFERGRQIGRGFRDLIERSVDFYLGYFARRGLEGTALEYALAPYLARAREVLPGFVAQMDGMAEGAKVPPIAIHAANAFEELESLVTASAQADPSAPTGHIERCSTFAVTGSGAKILGHDEQWLADDAGCVGIVVEVMPSGTTIVSPTVPVFLPAVGMNSSGGAVGVMSLRAADDGVGVPRVLVSRYALEAIDRSDAIRRASFPGRAGGYAHLYTFRCGDFRGGDVFPDAFVIETTGRRHAVVEGPGPHTNHYLSPELVEVGSEPSPGSRARLERLRELLVEAPPHTPDEAMRVLADHGSSPEAICVHADPALGDEAGAVIFSMVCDVEEGRMWVAPGNPCESAFQEVDLTGIL